jgi:hypothetical protein
MISYFIYSYKHKPKIMKKLFLSLLTFLSLAMISCEKEADLLTEPRDQKEITDLVNRLFMYTDERNWQGIQNEVFTPSVFFDMESNGGGAPRTLSAGEITSMWDQGLRDIDEIHHQSGHYIITVNNNAADVYAYGVATHYRAAATRGNTRTFVGSYDIKTERTANGWRINYLKFNLKYLDGNLTLE